jgi:HlyD family secretion protein
MPSTGTKWIRRLSVVLLLVVIAVALRMTVFRPEPVPVTIFRAAAGRVEDTVTNSKAGTVATRHRAALSPEIGGRVEFLPVREGDRVERGTLLMRLAGADYRAQVALNERALEASEATEREACATAGQAERDLTRYLQLATEQIVSEEILDQVRGRRDSSAARCDAARAQVLQAGAALELARVNLSKTVLRAPFDGVITEVSTELGEWITPSPPGVPIPPVIEIIDPGAIYVVAPLDEVDVGKVRVDHPVRITLDAFPDDAFMGRISRVAPFVRDAIEQNRTFDVEVEFDDEEFARTLLPGTSADVEVILDSRDDVLRIPSYALMEGGRVLVVNDDTLVAVPVETGLRNWEFTEITGGLEAGDRVVVSLDRVEVQEGANARITGETLK